MKPISIIFAAALTASLAAGCARPAYVVKSDAGKAWMQGPVKQIRETYFYSLRDAAALPDALGEFDTYTVLDYNRAGNITRMESFKGPDSVRIAKEEYFYDSSGERQERAVVHDLARRGTTTVLYNYDSQGRLVSEVESNGFYRFDVTYDRHGYPRTRTTNSHESGKNVVIARYIHDRHGRLKKLKGERREKYLYRPDGVIAEIRGGRMTKDFYNGNGDLETMAVRINRRNAKGRVYERFSVTLTAEYDYDEHGNWIRRVQLYRGEVQSVSVRETDYYEDR